LEENIEEEKAANKMDCGQLSKWKKTSTSALDHLAEKEEGHASEALKTRVNLT
jgi:hypothetical protein